MRIVSLTALITLIAGLANAQPYTGDIYTVTSSGTLWKITRAGIPTSLAGNATLSDGITNTYDNQGILWSDYGSSTTTIASAIYEWRNNANTALFTTTDFQIEELLVNQNGEVVFTGLDRSMSPVVHGVFTWTGGTSVSTITTTGALGVSKVFLDGGLDVNIATGNYLFSSSTAPGQIWDVSDSGAVTSVITTPVSPPSGRYSLSQDRRDGTIYQSEFDNYYDVTGGTQTIHQPTPRGANPVTDHYYALKIDRASTPDASRMLYAVYQSTSTMSSGIHMVSNPSSAPTYTSTTVTHATSPGRTYGMVFGDGKNIGSLKTGPGAYTLNFNFPGEAGSQFLAAVSAGGYNPGFQINGNNVCLNVDNLTLLSIQGLLKPFFDGGPGILDGNANGTGSVALGVDNLNVLVHIVAVTVRGGNINTISSPYPLKL